MALVTTLSSLALALPKEILNSHSTLVATLLGHSVNHAQDNAISKQTQSLTHPNQHHTPTLHVLHPCAFNSVLAVLPQVNHLNTISLTKIEKGIATITTYLISFTYYNRSHVNVFFMQMKHGSEGMITLDILQNLGLI